jgi:hypothetical protein
MVGFATSEAIADHQRLLVIPAPLFSDQFTKLTDQPRLIAALQGVSAQYAMHQYLLSFGMVSRRSVMSRMAFSPTNGLSRLYLSVDLW